MLSNILRPNSVTSLWSTSQELGPFALEPYCIRLYTVWTKNTADLLRVKGLVICFYLGWSSSILQFRQNIIKVGTKSWLLTCCSNITLSLPSYTGSALKRELNFCNGYLSLLYFCLNDFAEILDDLQYCKSSKSWVGGPKKVKNMMT